jgi:hypothetical protein
MSLWDWIEMKLQDDLQLLLDFVKARVLWRSIDELCKQHIDVMLNVKLFWSFWRLIQKFEDMLDC